MKLSENGKKKQKAILRTVALGLPVAGLLAAAGVKGCSSEPVKGCSSEPMRRYFESGRTIGDVEPMSGRIRHEDPAECVERTTGKIIASPEPKKTKFSDIGER